MLIVIGLFGIIMGAISDSVASVIAGIALIALSYLGNPVDFKNTFKVDTKQVISRDNNKGE